MISRHSARCAPEDVWILLWREVFPEPLAAIRGRFTDAIGEGENFIEAHEMRSHFVEFEIDDFEVLCIVVKNAGSNYYTYDVYRQQNSQNLVKFSLK